jgi:exodeoxyribonuclease VII large subunit
MMQGDGMSGQERVFTVSEVNRMADGLLKDLFLWVEGEVCDLRMGYEGFGFFGLRDEHAYLPCVIFGEALRRLDFKLSEGAAILARGSLGIYAKRGQFRLNVLEAEESGEGRLRREFQALFEKLSREGLFSQELKRPLPEIPFRIGLVTSPEGAALHDVLTTINRRFPAARVFLRGARVQGEGAEEDIARALDFFNRAASLYPVEVIILARGGGSLEDLHPFNTEAVARAIRLSTIPVITGVGHEPDYTIADFAADHRAATPTAAAQVAVPVMSEILGRLEAGRRRLEQALDRRVEREERRLGHLAARRVFSSPDPLLFPAFQGLEDAHAGLRQAMWERLRSAGSELREKLMRLRGLGRERRDLPLRLRLAAERIKRSAVSGMAGCERELAEGRGRLERAVVRRVERGVEAWKSEALRLEGLSPLRPLRRGYAIACPEGSRRPLKEYGEVAPGARLELRLYRGMLRCVVQEAEEGEAALLPELPAWP